jgi:hypothetical protein
VELGDDGPADGVGGVFGEEADEGGEAGAVGEVGEDGDVVAAGGGVVLAVLGEDALDLAGVGGFGPGEFEDQFGGAGADFGVGGVGGVEDGGARRDALGEEFIGREGAGLRVGGGELGEESFGGFGGAGGGGGEAGEKEENG